MKSCIVTCFFELNNSITRGHNMKLSKSHCRLDCRKFSFSQRIINIWNNLDTNIVNAPNTNTFKKLLDEKLYSKQYQFDE